MNSGSSWHQWDAFIILRVWYYRYEIIIIIGIVCLLRGIKQFYFDNRKQYKNL